MLITGMLEIGNHIIANINTLVYYTVTLLMIIPIYKHYSKSPGLVQKGILTIAVIVTILWGAENFLFGHGILIYNSLTPGIASILIGLIAIYLLNVFIFANSDGFFKDPDVLIITGVLVRSITFGFGLWLFKFDLGFDIEFLSNLLIGINVGLCLSDLFFLLAISRIGSKETVRVER